MNRDRPDGSAGTEGVLAAAGAFVLWGLLPVYWKALGAFGPVEIIAHRIVWSLVFTAVLVSMRGSWSGIGRALRSRRDGPRIAVSAALLSANWLLYVWGVNTGRVLETSLGYYVTPLANVALGTLFLGERLRRLQVAALLLAAAGVLNQIAAHGRFPWIALGLAGTFSLYGLLRKTATLDSLPGLAAETALLTVPAAAYLAALAAGGGGAVGHAGIAGHLLLAGTGVVTAVPLLLFAHGARRVRLTTVGILQYLAPTGTFLLGVLLYREPFDRTRLLTFVLIWAAVAIYAADALARARRGNRCAGPGDSAGGG